MNQIAGIGIRKTDSVIGKVLLELLRCMEVIF